LASLMQGVEHMEWMIWLQRGAPLLAAFAIVTGALSVGTLFAVSWISGRARLMADAAEIGRLALMLFYRWTLPCFVLSIASGAGWFAGRHLDRLYEPVMLAPAVAVVAMLLLLGIVAGRARRVATNG
jgi:hypothetical protein